jgi:uncharacterized protein (DUF58 family)
MNVSFKKIFARLFSAKRPFRLTRPGWVFILYSIGVGAGAINTGNNLLYIVFGIFLGLLLASGFLSDLSLWGLNVTWILPSTLRAGEPANFWLAITNTKRWWPSLGVSIILEGSLSGRTVRFSAYAPCVRKRETVRLPAGWTPEIRGEFKLTEIRVSTRYPFGLLEKWWRVYRGEPVATALVQPPRLSVSEHFIWDAVRGDDRASARNAPHEGSSSSTVRDYRAGDSPRRIHWRASAKRGGLMYQSSNPSWLVRQMEPEDQHRVVLELPAPLEVGQRSDADLELLVAFASSLRDRLLERGWNVVMVLSKRVVLDEAVFFALWNPRAVWDYVPTAPWDGRDAERMSVIDLFEKSIAGKAA